MKTLPHSIDFEQTVLGAALIDGSGVSEMIEVLRKVNVFYDPKHQIIYNTILELYENSDPVDVLTVSDKLVESKQIDKIGGYAFLIDLTQKIATSAHIEYHCRVLMQYYVKRKTISLGKQLQKMGYEEDSDIFDVLDSSQRQMDDTTEWLMTKKPNDLPNIVSTLLNKTGSKEASGVPSALPKLQEKINGWQAPNLIILAARPGMGKTAYMLTEAKAAAKKGFPVGIFSMEMGDTELVARMMSDEFNVPNERLARNRLNKDELLRINIGREKFTDLPIYIHDQPAMTPLEVKIQASKWKREKGIKMIFVDYLQLMQDRSNGGNREQEISSISRALKGIAKELDIPVMALSQLSRAVETRGGMRRPMLSDLRESGAIEQDADMVMFMLRPEYYNIQEWDDDSRGNTSGQVEINIAKFRNGDTGAVKLGCNLKYMRFFDLEENWGNEPYIPTISPEEAFENSSIKPDDIPF